MSIIWLGLTLLAFLIVVNVYGDYYYWDEDKKDVDIIKSDQSSWWKVQGTIPSTVLLLVLAPLVGLLSAFGLLFAKAPKSISSGWTNWRKRQAAKRKERSHPYRTQLKDLYRVLAELDSLSSTENVSQLRSKVQLLVQEMEGATESVDERIHTQRLRLEQAAKSELKASQLGRKVEEIADRLMEDRVREEVQLNETL